MGNKPRKNWADADYWQSADFQSLTWDFYFQQLQTLAMSRFKWVDLPPYVDVRFLEWTLMTQGQATISWPLGLVPENAFAMQAVVKSGPNANYNWDKWQARGVNGKGWQVDSRNGVFVWDNPLRRNICPSLQLIAYQMANVSRSMDVVRMHLRHPYILRGPRSMAQQMRAIYAQVSDGEPALILYNDAGMPIDIDVLQTSTGREDYELQALQENLNNLWPQALRFLGIQSTPYKAARQTSEEVTQGSQSADVMALGPLDMRRKACDELNQLTGGHAKVVFNRDIITSDYNFINDMQIQNDIDDSGTSNAS